MFAWIRSHRVLTLSGLTIGLGLCVLVLWWFQPQKAFIDDTVDEAIPTIASTTTMPPVSTTTRSDDGVGSDTTTTTAAPISYPVVVSEGTFIDVAHGGSGRVLVLELEDGSRTLRFEDLDILNGPDLRVILSDRPLDGGDDYADGEYVDLGALKGNVGSQNYEIPADVDLGRFVTAAIWCRRFDTTFNAATLSATV